MKKISLMLLCAAGISVAACNKTEKVDSDAAVVVTEDPETDYNNRYRQQADEAASQMARDLQMDQDTAMQRKVSTVYYTRASRRNEARRKYTVDTTGMASELRQYDLEADQEFREMLNPEQYNVYQTNRTNYYGRFTEPEMNSSETTSSGSTSLSAGGSEGTSTQLPPDAEVKTKTEKDGDTKTEIETATSETKIKRDADGDVKIKTENKN